MVKCCVVGCTTGYKSNNEKISIFKVPNNPEDLKKWGLAIPRKNFVVTSTTRVCEKHFCETDIIRFWESGSGDSLVKVPYTKIRLKKGAVPSIFPGPSYLSKKKTERTYPVKRQLFKNENIANNFHDNNISTIHSYNKNETPNNSNNLFQQLAAFKNIQSLIKWPLCSPVCENVGQPNFCFVSFCSGASIPTIEKYIKVDRSGNVKFGIFGQEVSNALVEITPASNIEELMKNIENFEKIKVCHGDPNLEEFPNVPTSLCSVSTIGLLKHYQCLVVLKGDTKSCTRCKRLRNVLAMRKKI